VERGREEEDRADEDGECAGPREHAAAEELLEVDRRGAEGLARGARGAGGRGGDGGTGLEAGRRGCGCRALEAGDALAELVDRAFEAFESVVVVSHICYIARLRWNATPCWLG
jgi:hypothetical protein